MKRQSKWIAALYAVLLALCSIDQTVRAQMPTASPIVGTYVWQATGFGENTVVLRIKQQGQDVAVYGALIRLSPNPQDNVLLSLTGTVGPDGVLKAVLALPPALRPRDPAQSIVDGTYNELTESFSITIKSNISGTATMVENIAKRTETTPYVVGIWQWAAADTPAGLVSTPPQFSGEFYILHQEPDGSFRGLFSGASPVDVGSIQGQVEPEIEGKTSSNSVVFLRTGTRQDTQAFEQIWGGQAAGTIAGHTESIQGGIEQTTPSPWKGEFIARWDLLR